MPEDVSQYRPDFNSGEWSAQDLHFLEAFATNPRGIISVLRNLPPEITGALCSRASRASGSLLEVLLKEYLYPIVNGDDPVVAKELEETVRFLTDHGFKNILNNQRAQAFYSKWLSQYGDDSIAQITGDSCPRLGHFPGCNEVHRRSARRTRAHRKVDALRQLRVEGRWALSVLHSPS